MLKRKGATLIEVLIVGLILIALSAIAIPRISFCASREQSKDCQTNIDILNSSIELYNANNGVYPPNLKTIMNDPDYFPQGPPVCPVDGTPYKIDPETHRVDLSGHSH